MSLVVSDTTPLNYLLLTGQVDILPRLFGKVFVPPAVLRELRHPRTPPPVATWANNLPEWIEVRAPKTDLQLDIGDGEDEAISLAVESVGSALLVDDRKARAAATDHGVSVFGTIAILELADEHGFLDFQAALSRLRTTTFRIEPAILDPVLARVQARKNS